MSEARFHDAMQAYHIPGQTNEAGLHIPREMKPIPYVCGAVSVGQVIEYVGIWSVEHQSQPLLPAFHIIRSDSRAGSGLWIARHTIEGPIASHDITLEGAFANEKIVMTQTSTSMGSRQLQPVFTDRYWPLIRQA